MAEPAGVEPLDESRRLAESRAQFLSGLGRRLDALRLALGAVERAPRSTAQRDALRRRLHAMGAAAQVLGFDTVVETLGEAEGRLTRSAEQVSAAELIDLGRTIDLVPSLVLGAHVPASASGATEALVLAPKGGAWPLSVLLFGSAPLAEALESQAVAPDKAGIECERTEEPDRAEELVRIIAPDVVVLDTDRKPALGLIEVLASDPSLDPVRIVAVGTFDRPEAAASLIALGVARVLPKPVSPDTLRRTIIEVGRDRSVVTERSEPIGDVTMEALGERIVREIKRGLVDSVKPLSRNVAVPLGEGTDILAAVWAALARVRELVTMRSGGAVRFDPRGPEGAVPLAPWMSIEQPRARARVAAEVSLAGRFVVVVDDDPAVAWFIGGLLRESGAEVAEAHDGKEALRLVYERWPDLVISDILMPELDGFGLCRCIKRDILLGDVPVILLSWKEDLLQRVRELGANADGYLRKEAAASTVLERIREVLRPRARVETRLATTGEVRGRLDGITPRLLLEVVCARDLSARIAIRDAAFLYEIDVRNGLLRAATRTSVDGRAQSGEPVLAALLGVRAGRFVVTPEASICRQDFDAPLDQLVAAPVARARALQRLLSGPRLLDVARIDVDERALGPYLEATPGSARALMEKLKDGESPASLVRSGEVAPHLLEMVLGDAVLHGGIRAVFDAEGRDPLLAELEAEPELERAAEQRESSEPPHSLAAAIRRRAAASEVSPVREQREDALADPTVMALLGELKEFESEAPPLAREVLEEALEEARRESPEPERGTIDDAEWSVAAAPASTLEMLFAGGLAETSVEAEEAEAREAEAREAEAREAEAREAEAREAEARSHTPPAVSGPLPVRKLTLPDELIERVRSGSSASREAPEGLIVALQRAPELAPGESRTPSPASRPAVPRPSQPEAAPAEQAVQQPAERAAPPSKRPGRTDIADIFSPDEPLKELSKPLPPPKPIRPVPVAKIALLRLPPPKPIRAEPAAEVAPLESLLADNEAESAFAEVLGATDLDWQDTDEEKRSAQSATVADGVGDEVVSSKHRSKALAPPTSTAPEPSPFEVAMKTLAAKPTRIVSRTSAAQPPPKPVPPATPGDSPPTPRGGWQIAFEDHAAAAEATPLVRTPLVRIERSVAKKPDEPKGRKIQEFDLGDAVLTMMELDDEEAIPLEERLTLSMDDRETTRPPVPAAPPLDAYPPQLRPPTPDPEEQRGAEEPVIVLARTKSFTPVPTPSSASRVSDSTLAAEGRVRAERSESPRPVSVSQRARDAALPAKDEPRRAVPATPGETSSLRRVAGVVGTLMATAAAFGVSFTMVRAFVATGQGAAQAPSASETAASGPSPSAAPVDESAAAAVNPAMPAPSNSSAAPAVAQATLKLSDNLDLPADLTVAGDKGLLEVNTEGQHSIYVDGVFVGRGPVRRMPLVAGTHEVRLTLDGAEERYSANVHAGKRTLLGASKPEP